MWEWDCEEGWAPKNWCFWSVVLKTLESPLDCKEIQPVHPKGDQSWCSLEGLMLKLKLQYFGHLMWKADSLEKTLMLGKIEVRMRRGRQRMSWLDAITDSMDMGLGELSGLVCCDSWDHKESDTTDWMNWTESLDAKIVGLLCWETGYLHSFKVSPHKILVDYKEKIVTWAANIWQTQS